MMKAYRKKIRALYRKHRVVVFIAGFLLFAVLMYIFYLGLFSFFGYESLTNYYPSPEAGQVLNFWEVCGVGGRSGHVPFVTLFCAHDKNMYLTPLLRSLFFNGVILFGVFFSWLHIIYFFVKSVQHVRHKKLR